MKTLEADANINYAEAVAKCAEADPIAYPMEPYNEYLQDQLEVDLSNSSVTEKSFWIGKYSRYSRL